MSRAKRELIPGYSYHITIRCNNREFRLTRTRMPTGVTLRYQKSDREVRIRTLRRSV
jgi:putative transposase